MCRMTPVILASLRERFPQGARVELLRMDDPQAPPIGTRGTVIGVDDSGSIMVAWDSGGCGGFYGSKVWHSNSKYRRTIWQCNEKFKGEEKCRTPHLMEEDIKSRFLAAFSKLIAGSTTILEDCRLMQSHLTDCSAIDAELEELRQEVEVVTELTQRCIQENARSAQSQEEYTKRYNGYVARYDAAKAKLDTLQKKKSQRLAKADTIGAFMFELSERKDIITEFDERLWLTTLAKATAYHDGRLVFTFQNGTEIEG